MALTKTTEEDSIEVVGEFKQLQISTATIIKEDGVELSRSHHRKVLDPGTLDGSDVLPSVQLLLVLLISSLT